MTKKIKMEDALNFIENRYTEILTVSEWAHAMGYSRAHFSRRFKGTFGLSPKYYLKKFRYRILKSEVSKDPYAIGYKIAVNSGFTNEQSLQKYLKYNYGETLNDFRSRFIKDSGGKKKNKNKNRRRRDDDEGLGAFA